jgi:UDP-glucose 4-epimerase
MILIVGATGYVGRYLSVYLKEKGYDVLALGRSKKVQEFFKENGVPFQHFDIKNEKDFDKLPTKNVEAIVNLAACLAEHETPIEEFFNINTIGTYRVLEFARKNNIKKVVLSSSHKVYNDIEGKKIISEKDYPCYKGDHTPYIISKIAAENFMEYYHKDFGLDTISLRFTGVHGYGEVLGFLSADGSYTKSTFEIFVEKALKGDPISVWGDTTIKRDHVYIKDVLAAVECAINAKKGVSGVYNIASGVGYSMLDEAEAIAKVFSTGKVSKVTTDPSKQGLTRGYVYSIAKAKKELGYKPKYTNLETMLKDYKAEWETKKYKNYHYIKEDQKPVTF